MHEYALAEAVYDAALQTAKREGMTEVTRIEVRIGELQNIVSDVFEFALREVLPAAEPRLANTTIDLTTESARFRCRPCGESFTMKDTGRPDDHDESEAIHFIPELAHAFLRCPQCASPDFEVVQGRGVSISALEGR